MVRLFKIIATLEGISALFLFFVAMPLKYIWHKEEYMHSAGMTHGVLFVTYIVIATMLKMELKWPIKKYLIICLASIPPFGTFYIEWKYFRSSVNENSENN
jgi:integral membrane protein